MEFLKTLTFIQLITIVLTIAAIVISIAAFFHKLFAGNNSNNQKNNSVSNVVNNIESNNRKRVNNTAALNAIAERLLYVVEEKVKTEEEDTDLDNKKYSDNKVDIIKHYPKWSFSEKYVEITTDPSIKQHIIIATIKALSAELSKLGLIKSPCLINEPTGYPGLFRLKVVTKDELKLSDLLSQTGLIVKNSVGELIVPDFRIDKDRNIFISFEKMPLDISVIRSACSLFNTLDENTRYSPAHVVQLTQEYKIKATVRRDLLTANGSTLIDSYDKYKEEMKKIALDSWVIGQDSDSGELIVLSALEKPALFIAGTTGSGKSVMSKSVVYNRLINNPDLELYFFDGKASAEWEEFADRTSTLQLTKPRQKEYPLNPMVEFSNLLDIIWNEYLRRQTLLQDSRSSNYVEHNKKCTPENKINPILVVFEETPVIFSFINFNGESEVINSASWKMLRLAREMRSYGFNWMLISQTVTQESVPPDLSKQALYVVGKSNAATANYMKCQEITSLEREFIVQSDGLNRKAKAFYLGEDKDIQDLLNKAGFDKIKPKKQINYDLVNYTGEESTKNEIHFLSKSTLFRVYKKEMWIDNAETVDCAAVVTNEKNEKIAVYYLERDELVATHLKRIAQPGVAYHAYILSWELKEADVEKLEKRKEDGEFPAGAIFISSTRFKKLLARSFEVGEKEDVFEAAILSIERQTIVDAAENKKQTEESDKLLNRKGSSLFDSTGWDFDALINIVNTKATGNMGLDYITGLKGTTPAQKDKKANLLEALIAKMYIEKNIEDEYEVIAGNKLKGSGLIIPKELSNGDGGADVVLKYKDGSLLIIQVKNYADFAINDDKITEWYSKLKMYVDPRIGKDITSYRTMFITNSYFTANAASLCKLNGIEMVDGNQLRSLVNRHQTELANSGLKAKPGRPKRVKETV